MPNLGRVQRATYKGDREKLTESQEKEQNSGYLQGIVSVFSVVVGEFSVCFQDVFRVLFLIPFSDIPFGPF